MHTPGTLWATPDEQDLYDEQGAEGSEELGGFHQQSKTIRNQGTEMQKPEQEHGNCFYKIKCDWD